jgi:hypothetical protein
MNQTLAQLRQEQKAATALPDPKKRRAEFDRLQALIEDAELDEKFEATQAEARADETRKQADRDLRQRNADAFATAGSEVDKAKKRSGEIVDLTRQLSAKIKEQRTAIAGFNRTMSGLDIQEDYGRFAVDWDAALFTLLQFHGMPYGGHAAREEPLTPMTDALDRLAARVAFIKSRSKLPA